MLTRKDEVGFVGLGNLGQQMSLRLIDQGWSLKVVDRSRPRLEALVAAGAEAVSPADLAEAKVVCFAVPDEVGIQSVLDDGLLERLGPDHTIIVHSTILPDRSRQLANGLHQRGARYLDAPVSGGAERARAGELALMLGGADDDIAGVRPLLEDLAGDIFHLGPVGAGAATKLANQLIMFATLEGVHEALGITRASGVSDDAVLKAVATGTGDTWVGRNWGFFDKVASAYTEAGAPVSDRPWSKDLWEVVSAGRDAELSMPLAGLLAQIMATVIEDHAANPKSTNGAVQ